MASEELVNFNVIVIQTRLKHPITLLDVKKEKKKRKKVVSELLVKQNRNEKQVNIFII